MTDKVMDGVAGPLLASRSPAARYTIALLLTIAIGVLRAWLTPILGMDAPLLPFVPAVLLAAYLGGLGPALLSIAASVVLVHVEFLRWQGREGELLAWLAHIGLFVLIGIAIATIVQRLQRVERELRLADRRKDEFLAMLAHELRNPLGAVRNAGLIFTAGAPVDTATVRRTGELLNRQVNHLASLIDNLLDVARITHGTIQLDRSVHDLRTVLQQSLEIVAPLVERKKQTVDIRQAQPGLTVEGDGTRLCQIVGNLLNNAAKYSPDGSRIQVGLERSGSYALIRVSDRGIGMDAATLPRVFELFMQGNRSIDRDEDGLGIGLTLVKHLVELHGGRIEARSDGPGQGSEFIVRLPLVPNPGIESVPLRV